MKKILSVMVLATALVSLLLYTGCGSDDGGGDPVVACSITVTQPPAGESVMFGDNLDIRWDKTGDASSVAIALLKDGTKVGDIHNMAQNLGVYFWDVETFGQGTGSDYSIQVTALGQTGCADIGPEFTIIDTEGCNFSSTMEDYFVVAPGDTCLADGTYQCALVADEHLTLTWDSTQTSGRVDIELFIGDFIEYESVGMIAYNIVDTGSYPWTIDSFNHSAAANGYFIRVSDTLVPDCRVDSGRFRMVDDDLCTVVIDEPDVGYVWSEGAVESIMFVANPATTNVEIRLYAGVNYVGLIAPSVLASAGQYSWQVSRMGHTGANNLYRIRIIDTADETCLGISERFTITSK